MNQVYSTIFIIILSIIILEIYNSTKPRHPLTGLGITELVRTYGFSIETHEVLTEDGYLLSLHRISNGEANSSKKRTPVLLMHGYSQNAVSFIDRGPQQSLGLLLVEKGYDVWLGNARGTRYSRKHKTLNPDQDSKFWQYSVHEIGIYDAPAIIDYVLEITKEPSLHYIGYSQGTTVFFILASTKPEYMNKIKLMNALAPAIFFKDPKGPAINTFSYLRGLIKVVFEIFQYKDFLAHDSLFSKYLKHICNENSIFVNLCLHHMFAFHGYNFEETNRSELSLIMSNTPAGGSYHQCLHILQLFQTGEFQAHDYGSTEKNLENYKQITPPIYDISNITTPVALYYASNDWTINIKNIDKINRILPNVVKSYQVPSKNFNHNDFINGRDVVPLVYNELLEEMTKY